MKFDDLECEVFDAPEWTSEEVNLIRQAVATTYPKDSVPVIYLQNAGITVGFHGDQLEILKDYYNSNGNQLLLPQHGPKANKCYVEIGEKLTLYKGKKYHGYRLIVGGCLLSGTWLNINDMLSAMFAAYESMVFTKHHNEVRLNPQTDSVFALGL